MRIWFFCSILTLILFTVFTAQAQENYAYNPFVEELRELSPYKIQTRQSNALPPGPEEPRLTKTAFRSEADNNVRRLDTSRIEGYYAGRIVDELEQFGYNLFTDITSGSSDDFALPSGAVQDDFILNIGDRLQVTFRGQINTSRRYPITNDGLLIVDDLPPVPAAGRSVAQVQAALKTMLEPMPNTDLYVSLDKVRQIGVLVIGHVQKPGRQNLTVFHSVLDAIGSAGGIQKDGSLRQIKLMRQGRTHIIDLYALLVHGSETIDIRLQDGDRLIVPPIGPTVAISGGVKRPGIYEIRQTLNGMRHDPSKASETLTLQDMLSLAGGVLAPGQNRFMHLALTKDGREIVKNISNSFNPTFKDGSILVVAPTDERRSGEVELAGHSRKNGIHALSKTPTLSKLLSDKTVLGAQIYPLIGVIERVDTKTYGRQFLTFPLSLVLSADFDQRLQDGDTVHLFSMPQIHNLSKTKNPLIPAGYKEEGSSLYDLRAESHIHDDVLASVLREHSVFVKGAVRLAGSYPVAEGATLEGILAAAGGLSLEANRNRIELTSNLTGKGGQIAGRSGTQRRSINLNNVSASSVAVGPGDTVRVNQTIRKLKNETILLSGEIQHPGEYNLMPGDRLSVLLARAGGLTPEAYPEGTIFSRAQERKAEEQRYRAAARDLERALAIALEKDGDKKPNTTEVSMARALAKELRDAQAVGRITVAASPDILLSNPELDVLLEPGDRIHIPKRPYNVRVRGEVLSPSNLQFRSGKGPRDYLMEAGGYTHFADKDRTFVLYPDGSAQPLEVSSWNYNPIMIPPGSTIVVPRDPKPFDFMETAKDVSQILSNLAITAFAIDDLNDD